MAKPKVKGAEVHRKNPSGGPSGGSGGSSSTPSSSSGSGGSGGSTTTPDAPDVGEAVSGDESFSLDAGTRQKLIIGGGVAIGAVVLYFLLKNRGGSDRGGGRRQSGSDDGPGDGDGGEVLGYPNIQKTPEDPLAADEEAIAWLKDPEGKAREVARDEMAEEELIE